MVKLAWAVFCQQGLVDQFSNALSIINVLEEIHVSPPPVPTRPGANPAARIQCAVVSLWEREAISTPEAGKMRLRLIDPNGKNLLNTFQDVDLMTNRRCRLIAELPFIPVVGEGMYRIDIHTAVDESWRKAGSLKYELHFRTPELLTGTAKH